MRWTLKPKPDPIKVANFSKELGVENSTANLLVQRGIETFQEAKDFFRPDLSKIHNPFLMKDMDKAVTRIQRALENKENILVYGDYDVDGTTSVALVSRFLKEKQDNIATYVPDREGEGYGISFQGIDFADDNNFSLVIALDCGIKAIDKIEYANKKNIDFIICDHHTPGETVPDAVAILNPEQVTCAYPYKELSGCGVGFKLIQALNEKEGKDITSITQYLDLVATSIAADIVPMTGENRILTYHGLKIINKSPSIGIKALKGVIDKDEFNITDVVFMIAPRINAAGRLKHAKYAVELLIENDYRKAVAMAKEIDEFNTTRKDLDKRITQEALLQIEKKGLQNNYTTVVYDNNWHKGVIGIVASRLIETHYKPTIVFTKNDKYYTASARSVKGYNLYEALGKCDDLLEKWGGHKYAAGLSLKPENLAAFITRFEKTVKDSISEELREPEIIIDSEIHISDINHKFYRIIEQMSPFGPGNMRPTFAAYGLRDNGFGKKVGVDKSHLKLSIITGTNQKAIDAIGFGMGHKFDLTSKVFKAAFTVDENHWNGYTSVQLKLKDVVED